MQHAPYRTAADLFAQGRPGSPHQVGQRLATQRQFRLRDHLTGHRLDQGLIQRGKKRPSGRAPDDLPWRNRRPPSDFASVVLAEPRGPPRRPLRRSSGKDGREAAERAESVARSGRPRFGGGRCRAPLAGTRRGKYKERDVVLASRLPFLAGRFESSPLSTEVRRHHDVICETDHLATHPGKVLRRQLLRRGVEELPRRPRFDQPARPGLCPEEGHLVGDPASLREIVGHDQHRETVP